MNHIRFINALIAFVLLLGGCSSSPRTHHDAKPDLIPFAIWSDDLVFLNTMGEVVHRVADEQTMAFAVNNRYFCSVRTGQDPLEYVLYDASGRVVGVVEHMPIAISEHQVAVFSGDLTPELSERGIVGLPYRAEGSETGWVDGVGLLLLDLEDGVWVVLDADDDYREVRRFEDVSVSWKMSEQLARIYERDDDGVTRSWVMGQDFQRVSPPNIDIRSGPTGPFYTGEDLTEGSVRLQVFEMDSMLFDLPSDFIRAYVFASGLVWAETFDGGYVFSNSGEMLEHREGWKLDQVATPCHYALFEIEGEDGVFVVNEDIEIIARYPGVSGHASITEDGYVRVNNSGEPYRVFDRTGALIWEGVTPTP
ncbi:MAG: hypothetical protein ACX94C_01835 [Phycisphaerales bacterium]